MTVGMRSCIDGKAGKLPFEAVEAIAERLRSIDLR